ncbi:MAG: NAD-dependent epimerase/dehydratase family protein, partial [Gemmatimonadales bacterium]
MTILLTGATGFVGRQVAARFIADGTPLRIAVRDRDRAPAGASFFPIGDLSGAIAWNPALSGVETVIHLAARVHVMHEEARDPLAAYRAVNRDATLTLARAASVAGVKRFVYISSIKVNGERTDGRPFTADDKPHPADTYGISKWEAEEGLRALAQETGLEVVVIRPPLVYGPGAGG